MPFDPDDLNKNNSLGNGQNTPNDNDDFVGSSFAVQFKPGDPANSVSDKLKESQNDYQDAFDSFKDEFDDFILDDSISAFKPIGDEESAKPLFSPEKEEAPVVKEEPAAPEKKPEVSPFKKNESDIPAFPKDGGTFDRKPADDVSKGPDKTNTPVFGSSDKSAKPDAAAQKKDEKLFNSGNNLDFATSEHDKSKSPFANAKKPVAPAPAENIDIPKAEKKPEVKTYGTVSSGVNAFGSDIMPEIPAVEKKEEPRNNSPFVIRPTPTPRPATPKAPEAKPASPAPAPSSAPAAKPAKPEAAKPAPAQAPAAHTAPAAAKAVQNEKPAQQATAAPHTAPAVAKAVQNEKPAPAPAPAAHTAPAVAKAVQNDKPAQQAPAAPHTAPAVAKAAQTEKAAPAASHTAPAAAAAVAATAPAQRPGEIAKQSAPAMNKPAPTGTAIDSIRPDDARRALAFEKSNNAASAVPHEKPNISPVTTVKKTKKKEVKSVKDPGVGGIIALVVIILAFIGILLVLQNLDKIGSVFGRKPVETLPTIQTTTAAPSTEPTTEPTTESTTEATTESTTEATTESTTEATTTTTEATTTTTEATTKATTTKATKATNSTTNKPSSGGIATKAFKTKITNFKRTSSGFKFDVTFTNNASKTANLKKSLKELDIQLMSSTSVKRLSSSYMSFKFHNGWWVGTPKDVLIKPGDKLTVTVNVTTNGKTNYFGYKKSYFSWR